MRLLVLAVAMVATAVMSAQFAGAAHVGAVKTVTPSKKDVCTPMGKEGGSLNYGKGDKHF